MDAGLAAILGAAVGSVGGTAGVIWDRRRSESDRRAQRRLTLLEDALNKVSRERRLLHAHFSFLRNGLDASDPRVEENDARVAEAISEIWVSQDLLRIHFGDDADVATTYNTLLNLVDDERAVLADGFASGGLSPHHYSAWDTARIITGAAQQNYIEAVRRITKD